MGYTIDIVPANFAVVCIHSHMEAFEAILKAVFRNNSPGFGIIEGIYDEVRLTLASQRAPVLILVRTGGTERYAQVTPRQGGIEN